MASEIKKLYDVPRNSYIKIAITEDMTQFSLKERENSIFDKVFHFHNVDGMYSYCVDKNGEVLHIAAFTNVNVVDKDEFDKQ